MIHSISHIAYRGFIVDKYGISKLFVAGILVSVVFIAASFVARILGMLVEGVGFYLFWCKLVD